MADTCVFFAELAWLNAVTRSSSGSAAGALTVSDPGVTPQSNRSIEVTNRRDASGAGDSSGVVRGVVLEIEGERITAVRTGVAEPPNGATVLRGLTMPGFANAHSHAFHRALRGRTHSGAGSFWTWREQMYSVVERLDPDTYYSLARATYGEMALAGMTSVGEFHYLHHGPAGISYDDPNAMGLALIAAAKDAGIRITLLDTIYLRGGLADDGGEVPLNPTQERFSDGGRKQWVERVSELGESASVKIGAAIHSVRGAHPAAMEDVAEWATARNAVVHAHVSEQSAENEQCLARYGVTPTRLLAEHDVLNSRFTAVHATHLTRADIAAYGAARCTCCFCPTTERDLADGIGPSVALRSAGARLSLGSDSHAVIDHFEEARAVELNERLSSHRRGNHDVASLAVMATADGHACLGWHDAGRIEVGALADFITVGLESVRLSGTAPDDALAAVIYAATSTDVRHVVVGGAMVVEDGSHRSMDVPADLATSIGAVS